MTTLKKCYFCKGEGKIWPESRHKCFACAGTGEASAPMLYSIATDGFEKVSQEDANRLQNSERLFCMYLRAQLALQTAIKSGKQFGSPEELIKEALYYVEYGEKPCEDYRNLVKGFLL